jgi:teichuronic acid exporter
MFTEEPVTTTEGLEIRSAPIRPSVDRGRPLRERVIEGVVWLTATRLSGQVITWIITIFVVRLLSPADYGLMGMAVLFTGILHLFNEIGLGAAIVQKAELTAQQISDLRWVIIAINVALFTMLLLLAPAAAAYFGERQLVPIIRVLAISFLLNGIAVPSASMLQRDMAFKEKAAAEIVGNLTGAVSTLVLAVLGYGVWSLVIGSVVIRFVTTAAYCVYRPPVFGRSFSLRNVGLFVRVLWYLYSSADMAVVGKVLGSTQLGYYSLAFQYSALPLEKFVTILNEIAFPSFSSVQHDTPTLQRHYLKLVNFVALVTFPMFIGLSLIADSAIVLLLGTAWLPVVVPLRILCVVLCFRTIETINAPLTMARGRPQVVLGNTMLGAIVLPPAFYIGARYGGIAGVAMAWLLTRPFLFAIVTSRTLRVVELGWARYASGLVHPIVGCLVMTALVVTVDVYTRAMGPVSRLLIESLVGCAAYITYQVLFNLSALQEVTETFALPARLFRGGGALLARR